MANESCPNCCQPWTGCTSRKDDEIHICDQCGEEWCLVDFDQDEEESPHRDGRYRQSERRNPLKISLFPRRSRSIERAQRDADTRESDAIRARIMGRVARLEHAESNRPEKSRDLEGALVEVWL